MILLTPTDRLTDGWRLTDTSSEGVAVVTKSERVAESVARMAADRPALERLTGLAAVVDHAHARTVTDFRRLGLSESLAEHASATAHRGFRS